jgi:hypothetical protein
MRYDRWNKTKGPVIRSGLSFYLSQLLIAIALDEASLKIRFKRRIQAMQLGLTDHVWSVTELVTAALTGEMQERVSLELNRFRIIQGGKE